MEGSWVRGERYRIYEEQELLEGAEDLAKRTTFVQEVENKHEEVVKMLLEQENVNPNQINTQTGRISLYLFVQWGLGHK